MQATTTDDSQLRPKRSHFNVNEELSEIQEDRIVLIYVAAAGVNSIRERWVSTHTQKKKTERNRYVFVLNVRWSDDSRVSCSEVPQTSLNLNVTFWTLTPGKPDP